MIINDNQVLHARVRLFPTPCARVCEGARMDMRTWRIGNMD